MIGSDCLKVHFGFNGRGLNFFARACNDDFKPSLGFEPGQHCPCDLI